MPNTSLNALSPNTPEFLVPYLHRITAPVNIITLAYQPGGFIFDETWSKMVKEDGRPIICIDMEEYGWESSWKNGSIMGQVVDHYPMYGSDRERNKLWLFLLKNPPVVYFKREYSMHLFNIEGLAPSYFDVLPIELLSPNLPQPPEPNREEYLKRGRSVFSLCGNSHPDRKSLADALQGLQARCHVEEVHHTQRRPLDVIMALQGKYQSSVNLGGSGEKCFRSAEACWNSVPIMADLGMEYRVKWDDSNAIMLPTKEGRLLIPESIQKIQACLDDKEGMWERMKLAHENAKRMQIDNYMKEINQEIMERL